MLPNLSGSLTCVRYVWYSQTSAIALGVQEDVQEVWARSSDLNFVKTVILLFFFIFFTVQLKIQIFFQCLHWRLFCSAPLHRCLGFVAGRGLMHFMLNNTLLGCSGREGEQKSSFCGTKGHCWQLVRSVRARTRLCKPVSQTVTPMWVCDPTHVPVHCQGGGCTDSESHPGFAAIPAAHTGLVCRHSCRCSHRTDRNAFSPKPHREK